MYMLYRHFESADSFLLPSFMFCRVIDLSINFFTLLPFLVPEDSEGVHSIAGGDGRSALMGSEFSFPTTSANDSLRVLPSFA